MAQALAEGFLSLGKLKVEEVCAYAPHQEKLKKNCGRLQIAAMDSPGKLAEESDILFIACKPHQVADVLQEIDEKLKGKALVSIAAGWKYEQYEELLHHSARVLCVMPNTPAMVGEGVFLFEEKCSLETGEKEFLTDLFGSVGIVKELPTELMAVGTAVTGCAPAFVDMLIEAYADAAVKYGMKREDAYPLISKMVLGTAKLQLETGIHPGVLKDQVCSPGGTTICGCAALEKAGFRGACIGSVDAVMEKIKGR